MLAVAAGASHPAVAGVLGLGAAGVAGAVVAMAWSVHARQVRVTEQLTRRQFTATAGAAAVATMSENGRIRAAAQHGNGGAAAGPPAPLIIEGPDTVVTGEQARYRILPNAAGKVVSWAAGGGSVAQSPDPSRPDELLLIADQPGDLMVSVRVREGMAERRATKPVTAVPDPTPAPPVTLRALLNWWGLVVVAVLIVGFAGALDALGSLSSSDFIALVAPLAALLGVIAVARGTGGAPGRPGTDSRPRWPEAGPGA
jgi:hypothetical protein